MKKNSARHQSSSRLVVRFGGRGPEESSQARRQKREVLRLAAATAHRIEEIIASSESTDARLLWIEVQREMPWVELAAVEAVQRRHQATGSDLSRTGRPEDGSGTGSEA